MRTTRGFTVTELLTVLIVILLLMLLLPPMLHRPRHGSADQPKNASQLRGIHQSAVIYSQDNNTWLPGLDREGAPLVNGAATGNSGNGDFSAARFWVMLNAQFIPGAMLINPRDNITAWSAGTLTPSQYSYATLDLTIERGSAKGRWSEWRDNANSQAILICDRNVGTSARDKDICSAWGQPAGDWRGNLVWGDNHGGFEQSNRGFITRYNGVVTTNDNLFASTASAGVTDNSADSGANALMVWP